MVRTLTGLKIRVTFSIKNSGSVFEVHCPENSLGRSVLRCLAEEADVASNWDELIPRKVALHCQGLLVSQSQ